MLSVQDFMNSVKPYYRIATGLGGARGVWTCLRALSARTLPSRRTSLMNMPVPGFDRSVWIRPETSDFDVYEQIFVTREYDFDFFSHGVVLRRAYEALVSAGKKLLIIDCGANIGLSAVW